MVVGVKTVSRGGAPPCVPPQLSSPFTADCLNIVHIKTSRGRTPTHRRLTSCFLNTPRAEGCPQFDQEENLRLVTTATTMTMVMMMRLSLCVSAQPILLKQQIVEKSANEGESIVLSCSPPESSTPPIIHWMDKCESVQLLVSVYLCFPPSVWADLRLRPLPQTVSTPANECRLSLQ